METNYLLEEGLNHTFDHFANRVIKDFFAVIDQKIKTNETKYGKLVRFLFRYKSKEGVPLFSKEYTLLKDKVTIRFVLLDSSKSGVGGNYYEKLVNINIGGYVLEELENSVKPVRIIQYLMEDIKSTIVHEITHYYQDIHYDAFNEEKPDLMYWTDFKLAYSQGVYKYIYFTRSEEISAYISEAYRFFRKNRKKMDITFQQCLCAILRSCKEDTFVDLIDRGLDLNDIFEEYSQPSYNLPYYFAYQYIFYVFIPRTRFYSFVEDNPIYIRENPGTINDEIANKNRQRIIKMMYDASELKKKRQMENALKNLADNNLLYKLFSLETSNARLVNKIRKEVLGE